MSSVMEPSRKEPRNLRRSFHGVPLVIEYKKGDYKTSHDGYSYEMYADYGYIPGTSTNEEGEGLDVYVGPDASSKRVFVAALMENEDPDVFEEYKVLLGFSSHYDATKMCREQYYEEKVGLVYEMTMQDLIAWAELQEPMAEKLEIRLSEEEAAEMEAADALDREPEPILTMQG